MHKQLSANESGISPIICVVKWNLEVRHVHKLQDSSTRISVEILRLHFLVPWDT